MRRMASPLDQRFNNDGEQGMWPLLSLQPA